MWSMHVVEVICVALVAHSVASSFSYDTADHSSKQAFDWNNVKSSTELRYHKCYGSFECARLEVPLDWSNLSNPNTVTIAITKLPAVVDVTDKSFGGTIVINPGGPGGSGVGIVLDSGVGIRDVVDSDKHFEILSFDPRGVQFTTPTLSCFQNGLTRQVLAAMGQGAGSFETNPDAVDTFWAIDHGIGLLCAETSNGKYPDGSNIRQYVSTELVAQDMLAIIDQVDAHWKTEARQKQQRQSRQQVTIVDEDVQPALLNYWGLSYGSYLGNTFASMFPDRIGQMILDGVVDAPDYAATGWVTNLLDHNVTWNLFFDYCFEAGDDCALFDPSLQTSAELKAQFEAFLSHLKHEPVVFVLRGNVVLLNYLLVKTFIHVLLYQPIQLWEPLAMILKSIMERDGAGALSAMQATAMHPDFQTRGFSPSLPHSFQIPLFGEELSQKTTATPSNYDWQQEAGIAILCGDGDDITSRTKSEFLDHLALLESQSPLVGSIWAEITLACNHWQPSMRPSSKNRFAGPFRSNLSDYDPRASPLLFIGNTADPVTPLRNAFNMAKEHEGAVVLTQDMPGHCAGNTNPSVCTFEVVKAFFANGTLPEPGRVCKAAAKPWGLPVD